MLKSSIRGKSNQRLRGVTSLDSLGRIINLHILLFDVDAVFWSALDIRREGTVANRACPEYATLRPDPAYGNVQFVISHLESKCHSLEQPSASLPPHVG